MKNIEDYRAAIQTAQKEFELKKKEIMVSYLSANNPYKNGDIIEDDFGKGKIIGVRYGFNYFNNPECFYKVANLTKKGTVNKREPIRHINQSNVYKKQS